jgi:hypothetical protein
MTVTQRQQRDMSGITPPKPRNTAPALPPLSTVYATCWRLESVARREKGRPNTSGLKYGGIMKRHGLATVAATGKQMKLEATLI